MKYLTEGGPSWRGPYGKDTWVYSHPRLGTLGVVWKDIDMYAATGPVSQEEDFHHADLGEYSSLGAAKRVVEEYTSSGRRPPPMRSRDFWSSVEGEASGGEGGVGARL